MLDDWEAHYLLEPWGGATDDERMATVLLWLVQVATGGRSVNPQAPPDPDRVPWVYGDFVPDRLGAVVGRAPEAEANPRVTARQLDQFFAGAGWVPLDGGDEGAD